MTRGLSWRNFDFILLGAIVLASSFGTAMIRSAVAGNEVLQPLITRQVYFALLGVVLIFLIATGFTRVGFALRIFAVGSTLFDVLRCMMVISRLRCAVLV